MKGQFVSWSCAIYLKPSAERLEPFVVPLTRALAKAEVAWAEGSGKPGACRVAQLKFESILSYTTGFKDTASSAFTLLPLG